MCALFFVKPRQFFAKCFVNVQNRASLYNEQDILWSNFCATNLVIMQLWGLIKQIWNFVFRRVGVQMGSSGVSNVQALQHGVSNFVYHLVLHARLELHTSWSLIEHLTLSC
jgi:hypothetical protein